MNTPTDHSLRSRPSPHEIARCAPDPAGTPKTSAGDPA